MVKSRGREWSCGTDSRKFERKDTSVTLKKALEIVILLSLSSEREIPKRAWLVERGLSIVRNHAGAVAVHFNHVFNRINWCGRAVEHDPGFVGLEVSCLWPFGPGFLLLHSTFAFENSNDILCRT